MHIFVISGFLFLSCVFPRQMIAAAGVCIGGIVLLIVFAQLSQDPKADRRQQQRSQAVTAETTAREAKEKAEVAKRCAYITTSGKFAYADFAELVRMDQTRWVWSNVNTNDYPALLAVFIEEQCKWPQDFMTRIGALALNGLIHRREVEAGFQTAQPWKVYAAANAPAQIPGGWVLESQLAAANQPAQ